MSYSASFYLDLADLFTTLFILSSTHLIMLENYEITFFPNTLWLLPLLSSSVFVVEITSVILMRPSGDLIAG